MLLNISACVTLYQHRWSGLVLTLNSVRIGSRKNILAQVPEFCNKWEGIINFRLNISFQAWSLLGILGCCPIIALPNKSSMLVAACEVMHTSCLPDGTYYMELALWGPRNFKARIFWPLHMSLSHLMILAMLPMWVSWVVPACQSGRYSTGVVASQLVKPSLSVIGWCFLDDSFPWTDIQHITHPTTNLKRAVLVWRRSRMTCTPHSMPFR